MKYVSFQPQCLHSSLKFKEVALTGLPDTNIKGKIYDIMKYVGLLQWQAYSFSSLFIVDDATNSQKDHKLLRTCSEAKGLPAIQ